MADSTTGNWFTTATESKDKDGKKDEKNPLTKRLLVVATAAKDEKNVVCNDW